jgi:hypothetical protein
MEISCPLSAIIVKDCFDTREVVTDMLKCIQEIKDISVRNAALLLLGTYFIYKIVTIKLYLFSEEDMTTYFLFEGPFINTRTVIFHENLVWFRFMVLTPFSTISQLYHGGGNRST